MIARDNGLSRSHTEDDQQYIARIWTKLTGREDFELAYSSLAFLATLKGEHIPAVKKFLAQPKPRRDEHDAEFLLLLKEV